ncbi:glutamine--fructose-6-phosphate transaminase (isomerizing) [Acidaminobacter sp. JC074]|uniref:glutamine--fructose-6-phosphate transaminase (isomerizing) n=1 Tax=Acidaminobacter sp. JC074 TaxID=2530199 RepID=UPI001F0EBE99|nr:glutamine--fructose-6-phosphate transaminase (isomerizing) [Acidaminobacter sp. JC074]MCH4890008.1 glutamine--fructose-6-phosphate transaminase (isomerizing) [Acidaminobacter sp. JC074]
MCGIVGYIGENKALPVLLNGLSKLEYRGYDSAGIALLDNENLFVKKRKGRLVGLENELDVDSHNSVIGIGHTRWATHGAPTEKNAHPHTDQVNSIAVIHNGIIENYIKIKEWLREVSDVHFKSETDSEVIAHLISYYYEDDLMDAVYKAVDRMEGAYAISVISEEEPDKIIAVRKDSPLIVGIGENEQFLASDIPALLKYTRKVHFIENDEFVLLTKDKIQIFDEFRQPVEREVFEVTWDAEAAEKEGFPHFTLKEIFEQPQSIKETLSRRIDASNEITLEGLNIADDKFKEFNKIYIVACGTAYHAGLIGKYAIENIAGLPVEVDIASEFRYKKTFIDEKTLFIAVSQSGETLDTLQSLREAKRQGATILSVVNVVGSSVSRDSDGVLYTWAGPEIGVASTKAYTSQVLVFYLLALKLGLVFDQITLEESKKMIDQLHEMPRLLDHVLDNSTAIQSFADSQFNNESVFFMGRGVDLYSAYEASLKFKEISYINSFAIAAGELKHGTIALIEDNTLVIAFATQQHLYEKMLSNIKEVKARGAHVVAIAMEGDNEILKTADEVIFIPKVMEHLAPLLSVVPMQLFAYYVSVARGNDVDKPRNLAKSVTVE